MCLTKILRLTAFFILFCTSAYAKPFDFTTLIPLYDEPSKIVMSEENEVAVVVSITGRVLIVANLYEETIIHEISIPAYPVDIIANPNKNQALITSRDGSLLVYDLFNGELLNRFSIGAPSYFKGLDKGKNIAFLGDDTGVRIFDIGSGTVTTRIDLNEMPIKCFPDESTVTIISQSPESDQEDAAFHLRSLEPTYYQVGKERSYRGRVSSTGLDESLDLLLLTLENISNVLIFDNMTLEPAGLVPTYKPGKIIAVDSLRSKVYLVSQEEGSLFSVSLLENGQDKIIPLPEAFGPIAVSPEYNRAVVGVGKNLSFLQIAEENPAGHIAEGKSNTGQNRETADPAAITKVGLDKSDPQQVSGDEPKDFIEVLTQEKADNKPILPFPEITKSIPDKVSKQTTSFGLRVVGKNFLPTARVYIDDIELPAKFLSSIVLTAQVSDTIELAEGSHSIKVINFGETPQQSNELLFGVVKDATFLDSEYSISNQTVSYGALIGKILNREKEPVVGATVRTNEVSTVTDDNGEFLLENIRAGKRTLFLDGSTAKDKNGHYPTIPITVDIQADDVNFLPFQPYFHRQKNYNFAQINPAADTMLTDPEAPGFEMRIPAGVDIVGWDGLRNVKVSVRTVPTDRLPVKPLPDNAYVRTVYMFYFNKIGGGMADRPIPITAKNDLGILPGEKAILWYYDESPIEGDAPNDWAIAGTGTVSPDGKYIVSDPGVGIPKFCCGATAWGGTSAPNRSSGKGDDPSCSANGGDCPPSPTTTAGDPVDLSTGFFMHEQTDLVVPGIIPIRVKRYYRSQESVSGGAGGVGVGAFGSGSFFEYDWWLNTYQQMLLLVTPGNYQYRFDTLLPDGTYINTTDPEMRGAVVSDDGTNKTLKMRNGRQYIFNSDGELVQIIDRNNNYLTIERVHGSPDEGGHISKITSSEGKEVIFNSTYVGGNFHRNDSIVASNGMIVSYSYEDDPFSSYPRLKRVDFPDGRYIQYGYDSSGRMESITNSKGVVEVFNIYDTNNRVISQLHPDGGFYDFSYTVPGNYVTETVMTAPNGASTTWRFNSDGYISEKITPDGTTSYDRSLVDNKVSTITDPLYRTTTYTYYDTQDATDGLVHTRTDPLGNVTTFEYETTYGLPTKITNALGKETNISYTFDTGRITRTEIRDSLLNLSSIDYDTYGMPVTVTDPNSNSISFSYDPVYHSQLKTVTDPLGNTVSYQYNSEGWLSSATAADGAVTSFEYDIVGRLRAVTNPDGDLTKYFYDRSGNLQWLIDPNRNQMFFEYDDRDRITKVTDQLGRFESYTYYRDAEITSTTGDNLKTFTDRKGQVMTFNEYDPLGRPQLVTFDDSSTIQYAYDAGGRLTAITDSISGAVSYTYNDYGCGSCSGSGLDRIAQEVSPLGTVDYTYDALGRRESMTLAGSPVVNYIYDDADRLTMIDRVIGGNAKEYNFEYDPAGRRTLRNIFLFKNKGKNKYVSSTYGYDIADNLTGLLLQSVDTDVEDYTLAYNENGLRKSVEMTGTLPQANALLSATFDDANEMLTHDDLDLTYDANGNLTYMFDNATQEGTTYTWDARNRLVGIDSSSIDATFSYDALNRRTEKIVNSVTTQYAYDGLNVIKETKSPGQSTDYVYSLNIDEPLALERADGTVRYYMADTLGSIVALADGDTGTVTTTYSYDAFGNVTINGSDENPFQYTGRENDETGLYYYRARYYSPTLRRFISEDPIGLAAGLNFYSYVQNDPVNFVDPFGLRWQFSQSTGQWSHVNDQTGASTPAGQGYSGTGAGRNNPNMQDVPNVGPTPQGTYDIGPGHYSPNTGPNTMNLTPQPGTDTFGRDLFRIHGNNDRNDASEGCAIAPPDVRRQINNSDDRILEVIP